MKRAGLIVVLGVAGLSLAGCGSTMRNYLEKDAPDQNLSVRQDLTMPPDLRLPPPGTTAPAPDPGAAAVAARSSLASSTPLTEAPSLTNKPAARAATTSTTTTAAVAPPANNGPDAVYTNAGISVTNPDGTRKTDQQLREELQAYYIAQKKATNPNYGTVFNMGNIFKDE